MYFDESTSAISINSNFRINNLRILKDLAVFRFKRRIWFRIGDGISTPICDRRMTEAISYPSSLVIEKAILVFLYLKEWYVRSDDENGINNKLILKFWSSARVWRITFLRLSESLRRNIGNIWLSVGKFMFLHSIKCPLYALFQMWRSYKDNKKEIILSLNNLHDQTDTLLCFTYTFTYIFLLRISSNSWEVLFQYV